MLTYWIRENPRKKKGHPRKWLSDKSKNSIDEFKLDRDVGSLLDSELALALKSCNLGKLSNISGRLFENLLLLRYRLVKFRMPSIDAGMADEKKLLSNAKYTNFLKFEKNERENSPCRWFARKDKSNILDKVDSSLGTVPILISWLYIDTVYE